MRRMKILVLWTPFLLKAELSTVSMIFWRLVPRKIQAVLKDLSVKHTELEKQWKEFHTCWCSWQSKLNNLFDISSICFCGQYDHTMWNGIFQLSVPYLGPLPTLSSHICRMIALHDPCSYPQGGVQIYPMANSLHKMWKQKYSPPNSDFWKNLTLAWFWPNIWHISNPEPSDTF